MDKEQQLLQPAYVLHQRSYRDTSVIVDVFTRNNGRISLIGKGVKQKKSQLKSILQSFQLLQISWVRRTELGVLTHAEFLSSLIQFDQDNIYAAFYLNELLVRLLHPEDVYPELFDVYSETLFDLNQGKSAAICLRIFEKYLLKSLGYEIPLTHEATNHEEIQPELFYEYHPEHGFVIANQDSQTRLAGKHILAFAVNNYDKEVLKTAQKITHLSLKVLLGEKPLKTRDLYRSFKAISL